MTKRIIVLSDGTGNAASSLWRTNVWRTFQAIDLKDNEQVAKYDDGVGTSSFLPLAILGGAFGFGLKRNVLDGYKFICRNYEDDAQLFFFGFSRGAFTVRVLAALVLFQGIVKASSEAELDGLAHKAYRDYRARRYHSNFRIEVPFRRLRDLCVTVLDKLRGRRPYQRPDDETLGKLRIEFIGVWDTVAAYGLPVDEMTRGVSNWIWPLELPDRRLNSRVNFARHALALDDERTTFHPVLWTEQTSDAQTSTPAEANASINDQRLVQVWFAGMHSNVGGGYPDDAMAFVPLYWMMEQAKRRGLRFKSEPTADPDTFKFVDASQDKDGRMYDSRSGLGGYYRYGPRDVDALCNDGDNDVHVPLPKIHESVFGRIDTGANAYAPISLPGRYAVVTTSGEILSLQNNPYESEGEARRRAEVQERIWNYVWKRRVAYFLTLAATIHLACFWAFHDRVPEHEFETPIRLVSEAVRLVGSFLPDSLRWWTDWYAANPRWFAGGLIAVTALTAWGSTLSATITDLMRVNWSPSGARDPVPRTWVQDAISGLRGSRLYQLTVWAGRRHVLPFISVVVLAWVGLTSLSHLAFNVVDSLGGFCRGTSGRVTEVDTGTEQPALHEFGTRALCAATGLVVRSGYRYEIKIAVAEDWRDASIATDPTGFLISEAPLSARFALYGGLLLRRILFRPYFMIVARVGEQGVDEYFLDPVNVKERGEPTRVYKARFTARRDGEVFLYVNDAVVGLPWLSSFFYGNNHGTAKITIKLM